MDFESMGLDPGDIITIEGEGTFRVEEYHLLAGCSAIKITKISDEIAQQLREAK